MARGGCAEGADGVVVQTRTKQFERPSRVCRRWLLEWHFSKFIHYFSAQAFWTALKVAAREFMH
jgi:hypothetical protein